MSGLKRRLALILTAAAVVLHEFFQAHVILVVLCFHTWQVIESSMIICSIVSSRAVVGLCTGMEARREDPDGTARQHTNGSLPSPDTADAVMHSVEEQGLRHSYGSASSQLGNDGRSARVDRSEDLDSSGGLSRKLATIVSGESVRETPSDAEMEALNSQTRRL